MIQNFSRSSLPEKVAVAIEEDFNAAGNVDSRPGSPTPSLVDCQVLSLSELGALRQACTELALHIDPLGYNQDGSRNQDSSAKRKKRWNRSEHTQWVSQRCHDSDREAGSMPDSYGPNKPRPSVKTQSTKTDMNSCDAFQPGPGFIPGDPLTKVSANVPAPPVMSVGPCGGHQGSSIDASNTTTLVQSSTAFSSLGSPANGKKSSPGGHRNSRPLGSGVAESSITQESSRRRPQPVQSSWSYQSHGTDRPESRMGSISESIIWSIRDYIRPRPSSDATLTRRSETNWLGAGKRWCPESQGAGTNWWREPEVGNKRSGSSFRNGKSGEEGQRKPGKHGAPNLNRELPALPALDQYRERKPGATHIAQLMRSDRVSPYGKAERARNLRTALRAERALDRAIAEGGLSRCGAERAQYEMAEKRYQEGVDGVFVESERVRHEQAMQRVMEERMKHHTRMASAPSGLPAWRQSLVMTNHRATMPALSLKRTARDPNGAASKDEKNGLRGRVSRLFHPGREKGANKGWWGMQATL